MLRTGQINASGDKTILSGNGSGGRKPGLAVAAPPGGVDTPATSSVEIEILFWGTA